MFCKSIQVACVCVLAIRFEDAVLKKCGVSYSIRYNRSKDDVPYEGVDYVYLTDGVRHILLYTQKA